MASTNKYDRQVRLWGPHGQKLLSESRILLLGASAVGSETLKNLILPQICSFTVVDDVLVTERDRGQNFFFEKDDVGKPAAERMSAVLEELNGEDVKGYFENVAVTDYIKNAESWQGKFDVVVGTHLNNADALAASKKCRDGPNHIPLVLVRQYGLIGSVRLDIDS